MPIIAKLKYVKYYAAILLQNWKKERESYAQHGEDLLVESLLGRVNSFIDIGANDGVLFSNTYKFAKAGARGLCFEPSVPTYRKLRLNHLFHPKVKCIRKAVSNSIGSVSFIEKGYESTLSYIGTNQSDSVPQTVEATTMSRILNQNHKFRNIDLLSVDVEGHEEEVFSSFDETPFQARVMIVETDKADSKKILDLPVFRDHKPKFYNGINLILLHHTEKIQITDIPPNFKTY
jgi:FkbM family methyltransferase